MLSPDGRCKTFSSAANGYVRGEGVGLLLLKPLAAARRDRDHIYALIRGSSENHGGRANSLTAPNPIAQARLIEAAYAQARIDPRTIGYIEAHGTGTRLGDPIEIDGLKGAFRKLYALSNASSVAAPHCAVGSVKTNIGHLELAAGVAGVIKVVLQMRHGTLVKSLHCEEMNPYIRLEGSPFFVVRESQPWAAMVDSQGCTLPRRAGVSAFGVGGVNAHVVLEEYLEQPESAAILPPGAKQRSALIVLSACTKQRLRERAQQLRSYLSSSAVRQDDLAAIAYTLQVGRDAMECRLACSADSIDELRAKLARHLNGEAPIEDLYCAEDKPHREPSRAQNDASLDAQFAEHIQAGRFDKLLRLWVEGGSFDWENLYRPGSRYEAVARRRVSLPTYPFAKERYWVTGRSSSHPAQEPAARSLPPPALSAPPAYSYEPPEEEKHSPELQLLETAVRKRSKDLEPILSCLLLSQLREAGLLGESGTSIAARIKQTRVLPQYDRWLKESFDILVAHGHLQADGETYRVETSAERLAGAWIDWQRHKQECSRDGLLAAHVALVEAALEGLPEVLAGRRLATDLLFPKSSLSLVEGIYKDNPLADHYNEVLAGHAAAFVRATLALEPDRKIRLLEIGAGTGGTSECVVRKLEPYQARISEYLYTDVSKVFLSHAERAYAGRAPYLKTALFDVERTPESQAIELQAYDIVIAANVLHATKSIRHAVRNAKAALRTGGLLLLNELRDKALFAHLTFGLLTGWWRYEDDELRIPGSPVVSAEQWRRLLTEEGFDSLRFPTEPFGALGQQVIVALRAGKTGRGESLRECSRRYLAGLVAEAVQMTPEQLDVTEPLEKYGVDSILAVKLNDVLRESFAGISSTTVFEYKSIDALAEFLERKDRQGLMRLVRWNGAAPSSLRHECAETSRAKRTFEDGSHARGREAKRAPSARELVAAAPTSDVAIIGLTGRFPQAPDMQQLWENLKAGRDGISEVPAERWDPSEYYDPEKAKAGRSYCKWGGFLEDVDSFDASFFNMSPREANAIGHQGRLFLETVWNLLEETGYVRDKLQQRYEANVGVYLGAMYQESDRPQGDASLDSPLPLNSLSAIANRVSYFFGLEGPSIVVDTMSSSAAVAIHSACNDLALGNCRMAIAGAVNLCIGPKKYIRLSQMQLIGSHPGCRSFGAGDGFLPAEMVGALLLKPLSAALADRDKILAVIKSTSTNHSGRSNGYAVPNPSAQVRLIRACLAKGGVGADGVDYVEAAANGAALSDAIEFSALKEVFGSARHNGSRCAIGAVKSNLGHGEAASAIAQIAKVTLQLRYRQLFPCLKVAAPNPDVDFDHSPFYLQEELQDWAPPASGDGQGGDRPRRALVNSFGAGGSNACLLVEEPPTCTAALAASEPTRHLIVLSAKTGDRLRAATQRLLEHIKRHADLRLADLAYTLQTGREAMNVRLAVVVSARDDLVRALETFLEGTGQTQLNAATRIFVGEPFDASTDVAAIVRGKVGESILALVVAEQDLEKLALLWTRGVNIPWETLRAGDAARVVALPTYPFAKQRC